VCCLSETSERYGSHDKEETMNTVRWASVLLAVLLLGVVMPGATHAASSRTVYVDDTGSANASGKGQCGKPNYTTIQAAVNDASAKRVVVCKGVYVEQVTVERSLTLEGRPGAVIQVPAGEFDAIVLFRGPQTSRVKGFTITGVGSSTVGAGIRTNGFVGDDIAYGPTQVTISHNHVADIRDTRFGRTDGIGIFIFQSQADVTDNTVERYGRAGIVADGDDRADTSAQIDDNTIRGQGAGGPSESQIGIHLDETSADVEDNTISGNQGSGENGVGNGILVEFATVSIRDNTVRENDTGVHFGPGGGELRSNDIHHNAHNGIELFSTVNAMIAENDSSDNGDNGMFLAANTQGNTVKGNRARGNGGVDIRDDSGTPPANAYAENTCGTSSPDALCND
jgi:parallel beta-helix repeat protein